MKVTGGKHIFNSFVIAKNSVIKLVKEISVLAKNTGLKLEELDEEAENTKLCFPCP